MYDYFYAMLSLLTHNISYPSIQASHNPCVPEKKSAANWVSEYDQQFSTLPPPPPLPTSSSTASEGNFHTDKADVDHTKKVRS